ncbi:Fpg/Nei family DNA glycosylase [Kocuria palustris]|uniref:Fpg/Nei family DNA glycosylase n=1 Tax=Kocuria palustris TaxID=71999 RepID=UPI0011A8088F|nr:zinc finger domain-containing protein [Kocuria palustris]
MPEGHSVHRLAAQLGDVFGGQILSVSSPQGRFSDGAAMLDGRRLGRSRAHGKQLLLELTAAEDPDDVLVLRSHLGIYGAWSFAGDAEFSAASSIGAPRRVGERETEDSLQAVRPDDDGRVIPDEPVGAVRVRLAGDHGWADLRGPALCTAETPEEAAAAEARLGPDPLDPDADPEVFLERAARSRRPIGVLLMEQTVIAGVGNIFRAESLFRQGTDPFLPGASAPRELLEALWSENAALMRTGVRLGRIVTTDPQDRPGIDEVEVWPDHANYVYGRAGQPCRRCGTAVQRQDLAGRALFWCPSCQPLAA